MPRIATLTMNPAIDVYLEADTFRTKGKIRCHVTGEGPGGGGINVARAIVALGGDVEALAVVGGTAGKRLTAMLDELGVKHQEVWIEGETRWNYIIFERSRSARYHFVVDGPALTEVEWRSCLSAVRRLSALNDYLVMSGSLPRGVPEDLYAQAAASARANSCLVVLDVAEPGLAAALQQGVWLTKLNRREFDSLAGRETIGLDERREVAERLLRQGAAEIIAAAFADEGTLVVTAEGSTHVPAAPVKPKSRVGAGDSYVGGLVLSLARGRGLVESVIYATAAAGSALMTPGPGLCDLEETERLYRLIAQAGGED